MCKELELELAVGKKRAFDLVDHLRRMGADRLEIPIVTQTDGEFVVTVKRLNQNL